MNKVGLVLLLESLTYKDSQCVIHSIMEVYDHIAVEFDHTRFALWKGVKIFLDGVPKHSVVADVGCGNGKYLGYRKDLTMIGNDACLPLCDIAGTKGEVVAANALHLPYRDKSMDAVICVAIMHHLKTLEERRRLVEELTRISWGPVMVTVWRDGIEKKTWKPIGNGDWLVPWNNKHDRYYHLFSEDDVKKTFDGYEYEFYEEVGNWYVVVNVC